LGKYATPSVAFPLDGYFHKDGTLYIDLLSDAVALALSEPVLKAAKEAQEPDQQTRAEQLWVLHKVSPTPATAVLFIARKDAIELLGRSWWDSSSLKNYFEARTTWVLAKSG
jgi:hypothetical protein